MTNKDLKMYNECTIFIYMRVNRKTFLFDLESVIYSTYDLKC